MHPVLYGLVDSNPDRRREVTRTDRRKSSDDSDNAQEISPPDRISTGVYRVAFRDAARSRELIPDNSVFKLQKSLAELVSQTKHPPACTRADRVAESNGMLSWLGSDIGALEPTSLKWLAL